MSKKDYATLARIVGNVYAGADQRFPDGDLDSLIYDCLYTPLTDYMEQDNPLFDRTTFCFAVATAREGR